MRFKGVGFKNCGAPPEQTQLAAQQNQSFQAQTQFYKTLTDAFNTQFANQQGILDSLASAFEPIVAAGPNQEGFSAAEESALRTQAADTTALGAQQAAVALGAKEATLGDGTIPSGASLQLQGGLLGSAANENARLQEHITESDFDTGRKNFLDAASALGGAAGLENPVGFANAASSGGNASTNAGSATNSTFNDISTENSAWMGPVFGVLGGIGGALAGRK